MKNKNGFTLVELLAVIAILSILVVLALPNIIEMFNNAKMNSFLTEVKQVYKVAEQKWISESIVNANERVYSRCNNCTNSLDLSGRNNLDYLVKVNKQGKIVKLYVTDGTYQYSYNGELEIENINNAESIAEINNDEVISIEDIYEDETAIDITVCVYGNYYKYNTITCKSNQTVSSCLNSNNVYHYSREFEECLGNDLNRAYSSSYITRANNCFNSKAHLLSLGQSTIVTDYTNGCYSTTPYTTFAYNSGGWGGYVCLSGDSEIIVYDKKRKKKYKKKLRDLTYDDLVLAWDFDKGEFVFVKPVWIQKLKMANDYFLLEFSDGSILKAIGDHRIYNDDKKMFTSVINEKESPIGMNTINMDGKTIKLVSRKLIHETIDYSNVITDKHINVYANGILTSHGINNIYKIDNMKFVKEERERFTREDFENISDELFEGLRLNELDTNYLEDKVDTKNSLLEYISILMNNKK